MCATLILIRDSSLSLIVPTIHLSGLQARFDAVTRRTMARGGQNDAAAADDDDSLDEMPDKQVAKKRPRTQNQVLGRMITNQEAMANHLMRVEEKLDNLMVTVAAGARNEVAAPEPEGAAPEPEGAVPGTYFFSLHR